MHLRPTAIYAYINCKTTQDSRPLHSDLESFHVQQPSNGLSLLGASVRVKNSLEVFRPHGDVDSLESFNLSIYEVDCRRS